ncbi:hypothetical protein JCM10207_005844 [Rhodosporidiobolus poonsookiae]
MRALQDIIDMLEYYESRPQNALMHLDHAAGIRQREPAGSSGGHNYRAIGHRVARYYGTTKEDWEAGRAW